MSFNRTLSILGKQTLLWLKSILKYLFPALSLTPPYLLAHSQLQQIQYMASSLYMFSGTNCINFVDVLMFIILFDAFSCDLGQNHSAPT